MKIWLKIETFINSILETISGLIGMSVKKSTPRKVSERISRTKQSLNKAQKGLKESIHKKSAGALKKGLVLKNSTLIKVGKVQGKTLKVVQQAKGIDYKSLNYKALVISFFAIIGGLISRSKIWVLALNPKVILTGVLALTIAGLASINIYKNANKIADKERNDGAREPAAEVKNATTGTKRKGYYKQNEKRFLIRHVSMPVYIENSKSIRTLKIDFTFFSDNRYIRNYFDTKRHLIKDRLNSTIQPLVPEFPLEREGKKIIKNKILKELNGLLKDMKIKGEIKEIYIHSILGG